MQSYFMLSSHDDADSALRAVGIRRSWGQTFFVPRGMIAIINSVILGVFVGLLLSSLFSLSLPACTSAGAITFLESVSMQLRYYWKQVEQREKSFPVHIPREA
jgi:hypothetical protein